MAAKKKGTNTAKPSARAALLETVLRDKRKIVDYEAARAAVHAASTTDREAVLVDVLARTSDEDTLEEALGALSLFDDPRAHAALIHAAHHEDEGVRASAIGRLGDVHTDAACDALVHALDDDDDDVVDAAIVALGAQKDARALAPLVALLDTPGLKANVGRMTELLASVGAIGRDDPEVVLRIAAFAEPIDRKKNVVAGSVLSAACDALATLGPKAGAAIPTATRLAEAADAWLKVRGRYVLAAITRDVETHVPPIIAALDHDDDATRACALLSLRELQHRGVDVEARVKIVAAKGSTQAKREATRSLAMMARDRETRPAHTS